MSGQMLERLYRRQRQQVGGAARSRVALAQEQEQRQPLGGGDQVQVSDVPEEESRKGEDHAGEERRHAALLQLARKEHQQARAG